VEHHGHGKNRGQRVGEVPAGDVRGGAVDRFVHAPPLPQAGRGKHADGTGYHGRLVAEDVAEHVGRHDDVKLGGMGDQLHGAVVHVHVAQLHVGIGAPFFRHHVPPELGAFQDVGLVHGEETLPPLLRCREGHPGDAPDLLLGIDKRIDPDAPAVFHPDAPGLAEVEVPGEFPDDEDVDASDDLRLQR